MATVIATRPPVQGAGSGRAAKWSAGALSCTLTLLVLEVVLRCSGLAVPGWVRPDPVVGWGYVPNARYLERREGRSSGRLNAHGLRDVEHAYAKPAGVFRILILGDSFTEAFQVPLASSYPRLLEQRLNGPKLGVQVEVIALARSGMGTAQQRRWFQTEGRRYHPDLVLLQTCINDPVDNVPTLGGRERVPYYVLRDGRLVLDESFKRGAGHLLWSGVSCVRRRSALAEVSFRSLRRAWARRFRAKALATSQSAELPLDAFENHYLPHPPPAWQQALELTRRLLLALADDVRGTGAELIVFGATDGIELEPYGQQMAQRYGLDLDRREQWWQESSRAAGVRFIPLLAEFRRRRASSGTSPHGFAPSIGRGHWNQLGHAWVAELLAANLEPLVQAGAGGSGRSANQQRR